MQSGNKQVLKKQGYQTYDSIQAILTMQDGSSWTVENSWTSQYVSEIK